MAILSSFAKWDIFTGSNIIVLYLKDFIILREIINASLNFGTLLMVPLSFFYYQWHPRTIERFITIAFLNFFRPKSSRTVNFFSFFFLLFNSKHKRKLTVLNDFGRKKLKGLRL